MRIKKRAAWLADGSQKSQWFIHVHGSPVYYHYDTWAEAIAKMNELLPPRLLFVRPNGEIVDYTNWPRYAIG